MIWDFALRTPGCDCPGGVATLAEVTSPDLLAGVTPPDVATALPQVTPPAFPHTPTPSAEQAGPPPAIPAGRCPVLSEYFRRLDGDGPTAVVELLAPAFRFATLWGEVDSARQFSGGLEDLQAYFATRDGTSQRHHLVEGTGSPTIELGAGYTTRDGSPLASFVIVAYLDHLGRISRLLAARTTALAPLD